MRIVLITPEAVPYAKTGGLADVAAGLSRALADLGHEVTLILPYHRRQMTEWEDFHPRAVTVAVALSGKVAHGALWETVLPGSGVRVVLIDHPGYFDRPGLYVGPSGDYLDNAERFIFFSRAALRAIDVLKLRPDIVHANDWQTGLVPATTVVEGGAAHGRRRPASVLTLHNLAFQGIFPVQTMLLTGLDWSFFNWRQMEFYGQLNLLKTGIAFADMVTTVSPTYSREVRSSDYGWGLEGVLQEKGDRFVGVLNGIDAAEWNPETDPHLPVNYNLQSVSAGKQACKVALQREVHLPERADLPLCGMISRMTDQKGFDLIEAIQEKLLDLPAQFVFLGTGEPRFEDLIRRLAEQAPERVAVKIGFDEGLAHRIEAGSDLYMMPSRFEPCGLNQFYSMRYGAVPLVHRVGGLADSVVDASGEALANGSATGFQFTPYLPEKFLQRLQDALDCYGRQPAVWSRLREAGMSADWSWNQSARQYLEIYERAIEFVRNPPKPAAT